MALVAASVTDLSRALSESEEESSSTFSFFGAELDEASFGGVLAGIIVGVVLFCILCFCFGRRVLMRYCLGRPYYCCCCPCIELCGCCQGFKRPGVPHSKRPSPGHWIRAHGSATQALAPHARTDTEMQALEDREALHRKLKANTVMNQKLLEQNRRSKVAPEERGIVRCGRPTSLADTHNRPSPTPLPSPPPSPTHPPPFPKRSFLLPHCD